jgi:hypothetical protein
MTSDWSYPGRYNLSTGKLEKKRECGAAVGEEDPADDDAAADDDDAAAAAAADVTAGGGKEEMDGILLEHLYEPSLNTVLAK